MKPSSFPGYNLKAEKTKGYEHDSKKHQRRHDEGSPAKFCLGCAGEATRKVRVFQN